MTDSKTHIRLSKVMADRGICSRREADELIANGDVYVDGLRVKELGTKVDPGCEIQLSERAKRDLSEKLTIILNKPIGYVSAQPEQGYEPAILLLTKENYFGDSPPDFSPRDLNGFAVAGRLDIDSQGLLVFTQDGTLARILIGEDSQIEKEYIVRVQGQMIPRGLELLRHGLFLDDKPLKRAEAEWINKDQLRIVLREGKKRQVRRMCEAVGLKVVGLKRVRVGQIRLSSLPEGQWRFLLPNERFENSPLNTKANDKPQRPKSYRPPRPRPAPYEPEQTSSVRGLIRKKKSKL